MLALARPTRRTTRKAMHGGRLTPREPHRKLASAVGAELGIWGVSNETRREMLAVGLLTTMRRTGARRRRLG